MSSKTKKKSKIARKKKASKAKSAKRKAPQKTRSSSRQKTKGKKASSSGKKGKSAARKTPKPPESKKKSAKKASPTRKKEAPSKGQAKATSTSRSKKPEKGSRKKAQPKSVADLLNKKWDHPVFKGFGRPVLPVRSVYALPYYALRGSGTLMMVCNPQNSPTQATIILFSETGHPLHRRDFAIVPNGVWQLPVLDHVEEGIGYALLMTTAPVLVYEQFYRILGGQVLASTQSRNDLILDWEPRKNPRTYGFAFRTAAESLEAPVVAMLLCNPTSSRWSGYLQLGKDDGTVGNPKRIVIDPGHTREVRCPANRIGLGRLQTSDPCGILLMHFSGNPLEMASADLLGRMSLVEPAPGIRQRQGRIYIDRGHILSWYRLEENYWQPLLGLLEGLELDSTLGDDYPLTPQVLENQDVLVLSAPERPFTAAEERVLRDFVAQGGSLLLEGEWGPTPDWTPVTQQVLGLFGASSDENLARDERYNIYDTPTRIQFEKKRNFLPHPITEEMDVMVTNAGSTLTGDDTWSTVVKTSPRAHPASRPVMISRSYGFGRILAIGDTNAWIPGELNRPMDVDLTRAVFHWLLFRR